MTERAARTDFRKYQVSQTSEPQCKPDRPDIHFKEHSSRSKAMSRASFKPETDTNPNLFSARLASEGSGSGRGTLTMTRGTGSQECAGEGGQ
jgi:hypothetical protein